VLRNQPYAGRALDVRRLQWRYEQDPPGSAPAWHLRTC
jgi:hypothetical protein